MKKQKEVSIEQLLAAQKTSQPEVKKGSTPFIEDKNLEPLVDEYANIVRSYKELGIQKDLKEVAILERSGQEYKKNLGKKTSFKFKGVENNIVTVSHKNAFSKIEYDSELVNSPKFDTYFDKKRTLAFKNPSDENLSLVIEKLGQEKFLELFQVDLEIKVKEDMNERQFDPKIPEDFRKYIKQYKASLKVS